MNIFYSMALAFIVGVLNRVKEILFDQFCETLNKAIAQAEEQWYGQEGQGEVKKAWVINTVMAWADTNAYLNFIERLVFKAALGAVVKAFVDAINENLGHDWVSKAQEIEGKIGSAIGIKEAPSVG